MNKKGTTLIEVLISVVLIATIMVFMFNILVDLRNEESLSTLKSTESLNRSAIIHLIQNDITVKGLTKVVFTDTSATDEGKPLIFTFTFKDNSEKELKVYSKSLIYDNEIWKLNNGEYLLTEMKYCYVNQVQVNKTDVASPYYYLNINIPVSHEASSKRKYDIDITVMNNDTTDVAASKITYLGTSYNCN